VLRTRIYHLLNSFDVRRKTHHFIHIPKNGGRSVREALTLRRVALERPIHARYVDLAAKTDGRYFCTVRNPWSRTASRYLYSKINADEWPEDDPRKGYVMRVSFDEYIRDQRVFAIPHEPDRPWPLSLWINQLDWITGHDGDVVGDCLRLEALDDDISIYFGRRINVPHARSMQTGAYDYRTMYTPKTRQMVADAFAKDIEHFGFDFEGPATRNTYTLL
jgi:hypothetical protein